MAKDSFEEMLKEEERMAEKRVSVSEKPGAYDIPENYSVGNISVGNIGNGRGKSAGSTFLAIFVVLYFIADVIVMVIYSDTNPIICVPGLGTLFLLFGLIGVSQTKITWDNYPVLIFPVIGALMTVLAIVDHFHKKSTGGTIYTQHFALGLISAGLIIAGVLMIVMPQIKSYFMQKKCTLRVMAVCVYLDRHISHGDNGIRYTYAPKWEYTVDGRKYERQETTYTNVKVPSIGEEREILVNPGDPTEIYRKNPSVMAMVLIMGIAFLAGGIIAAYTEFFAGGGSNF